MSADPKVIPFEAPTPPHLQAPVLLPAGETELLYLSHHVGNQFKRGVLTVWFSAVDYGGVAVPSYYNVRVTGKRTFVASRGGNLVADFQRLFTRPLGRLDRFPVHWLESVRLLAEIGTVTRDHKQKDRGEGAAYSVVRKLVKVI